MPEYIHYRDQVCACCWTEEAPLTKINENGHEVLICEVCFETDGKAVATKMPATHEGGIYQSIRTTCWCTNKILAELRELRRELKTIQGASP
jgi:hypothetical protein